MKKEYETPTLDLIRLSLTDVLVDSKTEGGAASGDNSGVGGGDISSEGGGWEDIGGGW